MLDTRPARPLTSREIAKLLSGFLCGLAPWCKPSEIESAIRHFGENLPTYRQVWNLMHEGGDDGAGIIDPKMAEKLQDLVAQAATDKLEL